MFGWFQNKPGGRGRGTPVQEYFRACTVYCRPDADQAVVAAVYNHGGPTVEIPGGAALVRFADADVLHAAIHAALAACEYQENFNYSGRKKSDWPAYQASGCRTIRQFEAEFTPLHIRGVNEKNLSYEITTPAFGQFELRLSITVNAFTENYGEAVHSILKNFLACKPAACST